MDVSAVTDKVIDASYKGNDNTLEVLVRASQPLNVREISHLHRRIATVLSELPNREYNAYTLRITYDTNK